MLNLDSTSKVYIKDDFGGYTEYTQPITFTKNDTGALTYTLEKTFSTIMPSPHQKANTFIATLVKRHSYSSTTTVTLTYINGKWTKTTNTQEIPNDTYILYICNKNSFSQANNYASLPSQNYIYFYNESYILSDTDTKHINDNPLTSDKTDLYLGPDNNVYYIKDNKTYDSNNTVIQNTNKYFGQTLTNTFSKNIYFDKNSISDNPDFSNSIKLQNLEFDNFCNFYMGNTKTEILPVKKNIVFDLSLV